MKHVLSITALIIVFFVACKKDRVKFVTEDPTIAQRPNCIGDYWTQDENFYGDKPTNSTSNIPYPLVYNNKVYVFDVGEDEVRFYNGTAWDSIPSAIPFASFDAPNFGFVIGSKGYLGNVDINSLTHPFYEYDFINNTWAPKANFPGVRRTHTSAASYAIGSKGYVVGGLGETNSLAITLKDNWEYNPADDSWNQKADVPNASRVANGTGFSINNKGYIVNGQYITEPTTTNLKQLIEYDPATDSWATKTAFPGLARYHPSVFVIGNNAYVGGGRTYNTFFKDFYRYNSGNSWLQIDDITVSNPTIFGFTLNNKGYVEVNKSTFPNFLMKYTPKSCIYPTTPN